MKEDPFIDLSDYERAERWGPDEPSVEAAPAPLFWHGDNVAFGGGTGLVKGILPASGIALLAGQSGAGKTFLALDLAGALAAGEPFFGRKIKTAGGTLFLAAEAVGTIGERIEAMKAGRQYGDSGPLPIAWREVGGLSDPKRFAALLAEVAEASKEMQARHQLPLALIIVDTLAAAFGFEDENAASEATKAMQCLQRLSAATSALVVAIAHYGKTAETGVRGSSAFTASADAILAALVERDVTGKVTSRTLALTKSRRSETGWNCPFGLESVDLGQDEDGDAIGSCFIAPMLDQAQDAAVPKGKAPGSSKSVRAYRDALTTAIGSAGKKITPFGTEGPAVWAVDREAVRSEFYSRWPADGETEKQRTDVRRQSFRRGEEGAIAAKLVHLREIAGVQLVWPLDHVAQAAA